MSNAPIIEQTTSGPPYHGPTVCELTGVTYRQLDYWARTDLVRPSVADAKGSGTQRLYDDEDVALIRLVKQCLDAGAELKRVRRSMPVLREAAQQHGETILVIGNDGHAAVAHDAAELRSLIGRRGTAIVLISNRDGS